VSKWTSIALAVAFALFAGAVSARADQSYGFGQTVAPADTAAWNIDVNGLTGAGLPPGRGSVADGSKIWEQKCSVCHGDFGEGSGRYPALVGGQGSLTKDRPELTVGSYWPYAPTLFDYIKRAMPFPAPESLSNGEVYALTAYILNSNDIVPKDAVLDAKSLAAVKMPNANGFYPAQWDTHNVVCMANCKPGPVKVTQDLVSLHVTPDETEVGDVGSSVELPKPTPAPSVAVASVPFSSVAPIVAQRCATCHAAHPTQSGITQAPMGILLDTPAHISALAKRIYAQSVASQQMPLGNVTHMTVAERKLLGDWISAGAKTN
jgi:mono/diheme cytochrome c family protein